MQRDPFEQLDLLRGWHPVEQARPEIETYDYVVISTSGGKDSQAMLTHLARAAKKIEAGERLRAVHANLGRVEWPGTIDLVERQCGAYGIPVEIVAKIDTDPAPADLLKRVQVRGLWPSAQQRWCTSDHKRGPIRKYFTRLASTWRDDHPDADRPCRILSCIGLRAAESNARARRQPFQSGVVATSNQQVDEWLPILRWSDREVWASITESGLPHHPAYDEGMQRLSCSFCVLGSRAGLIRAAQLRPDLAAEYRAVEVEVGHSFRADLTMGDIIEVARTG